MKAPKQECGVFGVYGHKDAVQIALRGLMHLQHRGPHGSGLVAVGRDMMHLVKGEGRVPEVITSRNTQGLEAPAAGGHTRYTLQGANDLRNVQPFSQEMGAEPDCKFGGVAEYSNSSNFEREFTEDPFSLMHNGSFNRGLVGRKEGESDTKTFTRMVSRGKGSFKENLFSSLEKVVGAYSLIGFSPDMMIGVRDPHGYRPLVMGTLDGAVVLASETCALKGVGAEYVREVKPGEAIIATAGGYRSEQFADPVNSSPEWLRLMQCIFENIYLSRKDSIIFGEHAYSFRKKLGMQLAREHPADADMVIGVPRGGNPIAEGFSEVSGIPYNAHGLFLNDEYFTRVFLEHSPEEREAAADIKFIADPEIVQGQRLVVVDDSEVRGVNTRGSSKKLQQAGALEFHYRYAAPEYVSSCNLGVATHDANQLIALNMTMEEQLEHFGIDSIGHLSIPGLLSVVPNPQDYCFQCFLREHKRKDFAAPEQVVQIVNAYRERGR